MSTNNPAPAFIADTVAKRIPPGNGLGNPGDTADQIDYRDRVVSGKDILPRKVDGRTSYVRRVRAYYQAVMNDLGGFDNPLLGTLEKGVAKQCAALLSILDEMLMNKANGEYIEGEPWDLKTFTEVQKALAHMARQIGYKKRQKYIESDSLDIVVQSINEKKTQAQSQHSLPRVQVTTSYVENSNQNLEFVLLSGGLNQLR